MESDLVIELSQVVFSVESSPVVLSVELSPVETGLVTESSRARLCCSVESSWYSRANSYFILLLFFMEFIVSVYFVSKVLSLHTVFQLQLLQQLLCFYLVSNVLSKS